MIIIWKMICRKKSKGKLQQFMAVQPLFQPHFCEYPGYLVILDQCRLPVSTPLQFVEIKEKGSSLLVGGENDHHETLMLHLGVLKQTQNITVEGV